MNKGIFKLANLVSSVNLSSIVVHNHLARLYGMFLSVCLGWDDLNGTYPVRQKKRGAFGGL